MKPSAVATSALDLSCSCEHLTDGSNISLCLSRLLFLRSCENPLPCVTEFQMKVRVEIHQDLVDIFQELQHDRIDGVVRRLLGRRLALSCLSVRPCEPSKTKPHSAFSTPMTQPSRLCAPNIAGVAETSRLMISAACSKCTSTICIVLSFCVVAMEVTSVLVRQRAMPSTTLDETMLAVRSISTTRGNCIVGSGYLNPCTTTPKYSSPSHWFPQCSVAKESSLCKRGTFLPPP